MESNEIRIELSECQRRIILEYGVRFADAELVRVVSVALKKADGYEICTTEEQLDELIDEIAAIADGEPDEAKSELLYEICEYLDACIVESDEHEREYAAYSSNTGCVYVIKAALLDNRKIWRKIAIREGQTLHDLHNMIFDAFDRDEEHLYSFFMPHSGRRLGRTRIYRNSEEYTDPYAAEDPGPFGGGSVNAAKTTIGSLRLKAKDCFYYLFDFGDEWWHEMTVVRTGEEADEGKYPRVIERRGESPEQYYCEEDEYEGDDEEEGGN